MTEEPQQPDAEAPAPVEPPEVEWTPPEGYEAALKDKALDRSRKLSDYTWRQSVYEGLFGQMADFEGHPMPINFAHVALTSIPWMAQQFDRSVPDEYVSVDLNADGYSAASVACPCGEVHEIEIGTMLAAPCSRGFYWFGQGVRVGGGPQSDAD